jgi:1-acyl-sn-glycerol-3-phosphate acyltransferase
VSSALYGLLWVISRTIGWLCFRYRTVGTVPRQGGFLIASNHASYLDIPLLGCGIPRRVWYMGRHDLFPMPLLNGLLQALGWIPLRVGRLDRDAFSKAVALIQEGKAVAIFPEGGRTMTGALKPGKPGIGVIVSQTGLSGSAGAYRRHIRGPAARSQMAEISSCDRGLWRAVGLFGGGRPVGRKGILSTCQSDGDGENCGTRTGSDAGGMAGEGRAASRFCRHTSSQVLQR